ncbi:uncharacterized protein B0T23DRAFT_320286 [Neurospora hispaniola]|uniref:Uncharacterized protein n=1 Tax=Neurospora hispaniola TaxID=588809 RepID=A0AAJ0MPA9_9PEZI|nr:hypothetical protein B0T23DRAFT_320286 [Neurospora hispaniola]
MSSRTQACTTPPGRDQKRRPGHREWEAYDEKNKKATMTNPTTTSEKGYRTIDDNDCPREINTTVFRHRKTSGAAYSQIIHLASPAARSKTKSPMSKLPNQLI